ncbi:MAG: hypothetical protein M1818_004649 [Claussenomyces sp. TS43310]|nr:MAG: hypothetical protein M1818_004649 [Claussenomyces sp. TS43310]
MSRKMNTSISLALSFAGVPNSPTRRPSLSNMQSGARMGSMTSISEKDMSSNISIYKGISDRPLGWKPRRHVKPIVTNPARDANIKKFDGATNISTEWDGLRRVSIAIHNDPELWYPEGDCLIFLYGQGQSKRGPSFRIPYTALLNTQCQQLLESCVVRDSEPPSPLYSSIDERYLNRPMSSCRYELYLPAPPTIAREQAMLYHISTRNFFAWMLRRSLVGSELGPTLVELLHRMNTFRSTGDNVSALVDYMDEEGYANMANRRDHALAILHLAEQFRFRDLYIDAYAHCVGMGQKLYDSPEFECISEASRSQICEGHVEMNSRLNRQSRSLSTFLEDELAPVIQRLPPDALLHMDLFRSFLHEHYVTKFGYYPPQHPDGACSIFPKDAHAVMYNDFQMLYEFLVDKSFATSDWRLEATDDPIRVLSVIEIFNERYHYESLVHPYPLLPPGTMVTPDQTFGRRFGTIGRGSRSKYDARLAALAALLKATNRNEAGLFQCSLVRAYQSFERDCFFAPKSEQGSRISAADGRKVRWLVVYAMLQTLHTVMEVPLEVHDTEDVSYHLCVPTAGCLPWKDEAMLAVPSLSQPGESVNKFMAAERATCHVNELTTDEGKSGVSTTPSSPTCGLDTIRPASSSLDDIYPPHLAHPRPQRTSFHEILIDGFDIKHDATTPSTISSVDSYSLSHRRQLSLGSDSSEMSEAAISSYFQGCTRSDSPPSSISDMDMNNVQKDLEKPMNTLIRINAINSDEEDVATLTHFTPVPLAVTARGSSLYAAYNKLEDRKIELEDIDDMSFANHPELEAYLAQ